VEIAAAWQPGAQGAPGGVAAAHRRWARELAAELEARALPGGYPNLLGGAENDRALRGFGPNLARLREVKRRLDPDGVFGAVPDLRA
jgi:FAD/FMN-containing dehydrogenase